MAAVATLVSINVGVPRQVEFGGEWVSTAIFKEPVNGPVRVRTLNLEGDRQADLTVHGGVAKAVYVYPSEHYPFWRSELPDIDFPFGAFGENLTTTGLLEHEVRVGDVLSIGTAEFAVTQPRMPCFKLGIRFGRADMVKRFMRAGRSGIYLRVTREGVIRAGDAIALIARDERAMTIADVFLRRGR